MIDLESALVRDIQGMSDDQLIDRSAHYNAALRRGRKLMAEGDAIVSANINLFIMCQNALNDRTRRRIDTETDRQCET